MEKLVTIIEQRPVVARNYTAQDGGYIAVFKLTAQLLKDDVAFADLASFGLLRWHLECFTLCLDSEKIFHVEIYDF